MTGSNSLMISGPASLAHSQTGQFEYGGNLAVIKNYPKFKTLEEIQNEDSDQLDNKKKMKTSIKKREIPENAGVGCCASGGCCVF